MLDRGVSKYHQATVQVFTVFLYSSPGHRFEYSNTRILEYSNAVVLSFHSKTGDEFKRTAKRPEEQCAREAPRSTVLETRKGTKGGRLPFLSGYIWVRVLVQTLLEGRVPLHFEHSRIWDGDHYHATHAQTF
jgi:hypothetical protein